MKPLQILIWLITHLGAWSMILVTSFGVGSVALRKHRFHNPAERVCFTLAVGMGVCALLLFVLGLVGLLYKALIIGLTTAAVLAGAWRWYSSHRINWKQLVARLPRSRVAIALIVAGLGYWSLLFILTQYPPHQWDAISNHLVLARGYLETHHIAVHTGIPAPVLPALNHMLFAWSLALNDEVLAQMIEHTFLMLAAIALCAWGIRTNRSGVGLAAAALWLAHPLLLWLSAAAYVDVGVSSYVFLGIYALRVFVDELDSGWWYLSMALLAMGAGSKLTGLFFLGIAMALGLFVFLTGYIRSRGSWRLKPPDDSASALPPMFGWKALAIGWAVAVVIALPWYGFVAYHTGNPLWPMFPEYSRGMWGSSSIVERVNGFMTLGAQPRTIRTFLMLSYDWVYNSGRFYSEASYPSLCPAVVAWPVAWIVSFFNRSVRWWTIWALAFTGFWFMHAHQLRYWFPVLAIAGLALFESVQWIMDRIVKRTAWQRTFWIGVTLLILMWGGSKLARGIYARGLPPVRAEARQRFLVYARGYKSMQYLNQHSQPGEVVCVINGSWLNYYLRPRVIDIIGALNYQHMPSFRSPEDEKFERWLESEQVSWVLVVHEDLFPTDNRPDPAGAPFWSSYELVHSDLQSWLFRHDPEKKR